METRRLETLKQIAAGVAALFGSNREVVIHDVSGNRPDPTTVHSETGHVTGRTGADGTAAVVLTMMSRIFAVWRKTPVTVFLICGIFPLVPGAGIYYTAYYFIMGDNAMALSKGIETIKIAVAIALAIVFVFSMPNPVAAALRRRK